MASINYDDERLTEVEEQRKEALSENEKLYGDMANQSEQFYQEQIDASKEWADKQSQLQQEKTDFALEQIEQQKEQAQKDYTKEQKGAYADWQKQSNMYGAQAEQMAASGLEKTGYSESSKVGMYNTYQNRMATARESFNKAVLNYDDAMKEAMLQNNSVLAEIAYNALLQQLDLSLQGFQYKNQLLQEEANKKLTINSMYDSKYQAVVDQINTENALAEQKRQYDEQMKLEREQFEYQKAQDKKNYDLQQVQIDAQSIQNESSSARGLLGKVASALGGIIGGSSQSGNSSTKDEFGNSASTQKKSDYYFDGTTQPRYVDNNRLTNSNLTAKILPADLGIKSTNKIWRAGNKYVVWNHATKSYLDVTDEISFGDSPGQPMYINNYRVTGAGKIKDTIGSYKNIPTSQNVHKAGDKYFVWDGKTKTYLNVTSEYKNYLKKSKQAIVMSQERLSGMW